jgi:hypothetical protein
MPNTLYKNCSLVARDITKFTDPIILLLSMMYRHHRQHPGLRRAGIVCPDFTARHLINMRGNALVTALAKAATVNRGPVHADITPFSYHLTLSSTVVTIYTASFKTSPPSKCVYVFPYTKLTNNLHNPNAGSISGSTRFSEK